MSRVSLQLASSLTIFSEIGKSLFYVYDYLFAIWFVIWITLCVGIYDTEPSFEFFILFYHRNYPPPPLKSTILQILSVGTSNDVPQKLHVYYISHII